jgi:hypothetical protein
MHVTDEEVHRQVAANFFSRQALAAFAGQHDQCLPLPEPFFCADDAFLREYPRKESGYFHRIHHT